MIIGSIHLYGGNVAPDGFLICDGSAISRSDYSELFAVIGTIYGEGDGVTTFNIPDLSGRVAVGASVNHTLGSSGGEERHFLSENELPLHEHTVPEHGHGSTIKATTPSLSHTITQPAFTYAAPSGTTTAMDGFGAAYSGVTSTDATRSANLAIANHSATACTKTGSITDCDAFDTDAVGGDGGHDNMQPYITLNHIIYVGGV